MIKNPTEFLSFINEHYECNNGVCWCDNAKDNQKGAYCQKHDVMVYCDYKDFMNDPNCKAFYDEWNKKFEEDQKLRNIIREEIRRYHSSGGDDVRMGYFRD
jgi:hypothetical protein